MSPDVAKTILVVDDSELLLEMARFALEERGFAVVTATDLPSLRRALAATPPDLIVCDVQMPDATAEDLGEALSAAEVPVWLFSALDERELAERLSAIGADHYVCKDEGLDVLASRARALFDD